MTEISDPTDSAIRRERGYASGLEAQIAAATRGALAAYCESVDKYMELYDRINASENPNLILEQSFQIGSKMLKYTMTIPRVIAQALEEFNVESAEMSGAFFVNASESSSLSIDSQTEVGASAGWGGISAHVNSTMGVKADRQRATDSRSSFDFNMKLGPRGVPEGIARIREVYLDAFASVTKVIVAALEAKVKELVAAGEDVISVEEVEVLDAKVSPATQ